MRRRVHDPVGILDRTAIVEEVLYGLAYDRAVRMRFVLHPVGHRRDLRVDYRRGVTGGKVSVGHVRTDKTKSSSYYYPFHLHSLY